MSDYPFTLEEFREIYGKVPRLCVDVVLRTNGGIVLSKRSIDPWKGQWHIPGGTVYHGEELVEAVGRVAKNELGIEIEIDKLLGVIEYPDSVEERDFDWPIGLAFECRIKSGELQGSEQGEEVKVFSELPEKMIAEQKKFLEEKRVL